MMIADYALNKYFRAMYFTRLSLCLCASAVIIALLSNPAQAIDDEDALRAEIASLQAEVTRIEQENRGLRLMLKDLEDDEVYIVVDTESSRLQLRQGTDVVHAAKCGSGSRSALAEETGRSWQFETPLGSFTVLGTERNPVWIRPDWSYVEENMPVPAANDPDRIVRDVLGKYALLLGNAYKIHGTKWTNLLGTHFTHGCVSLGDDDLELVYKSVKVGTRVYLY
ncbi:MAG TPA: L,D-transpeptidase family protein [Nitrospirota bacterium]